MYNLKTKLTSSRQTTRLTDKEDGLLINSGRGWRVGKIGGSKGNTFQL